MTCEQINTYVKKRAVTRVNINATHFARVCKVCLAVLNSNYSSHGDGYVETRLILCVCVCVLVYYTQSGAISGALGQNNGIRRVFYVCREVGQTHGACSSLRS